MWWNNFNKKDQNDIITHWFIAKALSRGKGQRTPSCGGRDTGHSTPLLYQRADVKQIITYTYCDAIRWEQFYGDVVINSAINKAYKGEYSYLYLIYVNKKYFRNLIMKVLIIRVNKMHA